MNIAMRVSGLEGRTPKLTETHYHARSAARDSAMASIGKFIQSCDLPPAPGASLAEQFAAGLVLSVSELKSPLLALASKRALLTLFKLHIMGAKRQLHFSVAGSNVCWLWYLDESVGGVLKRTIVDKC